MNIFKLPILSVPASISGKRLQLADHLLPLLESYVYCHALSSKIGAVGIIILSLIPILGFLRVY